MKLFNRLFGAAPTTPREAIREEVNASQTRHDTVRQKLMNKLEALGDIEIERDLSDALTRRDQKAKP